MVGRAFHALLWTLFCERWGLIWGFHGGQWKYHSYFFYADNSDHSVRTDLSGQKLGGERASLEVTRVETSGCFFRCWSGRMGWGGIGRIQLWLFGPDRWLRAGQIKETITCLGKLPVCITILHHSGSLLRALANPSDLNCSLPHITMIGRRKSTWLHWENEKKN